MKKLKKFNLLVVFLILFATSNLNASFMDLVQLLQNTVKVLANEEIEYKNIILDQSKRDKYYINKFYFNSRNCDSIITNSDFHTTCINKKFAQYLLYAGFDLTNLSDNSTKFRIFKKEVLDKIVPISFNPSYMTVIEYYKREIEKKYEYNIIIEKDFSDNLNLKGLRFIGWRRSSLDKKCMYIPNNKKNYDLDQMIEQCEYTIPLDDIYNYEL